MRRTPLAVAVAAVLTLVACGGDDDTADGDASTATDVTLVPATPPPTIPVPSVELPAEAPTELGVTTLAEGTGREAAEGDGVLVRYVGVSFETGQEFDNNFGGEPLSVTLGSGGVIPGWEQGLVGAKAGEQRQLDIPADLAYGPTPTTVAGATTVPGGRPTGPLSFVIDVLAVVPPVDPSAAPTAEDIPTLCPREATATTGETVTGDASTSPSGSAACDAHTSEVVTEDLIEGDGATVDMGMTALVRFVLARADNGVVLRSTWSEQGPTQLVLAPTGQMDGMIEGIAGMRVGGRRAITVPYELAFGENGFPEAGLPARTDAVVIIDLVAAY
jgi:peptidylprolyl isomerase